MVNPSSLMTNGVEMKEFGNICLFKFTEQLQSRFEELLSKKKTDDLSEEEEAEYRGISDLQGGIPHPQIRVRLRIRRGEETKRKSGAVFENKRII